MSVFIVRIELYEATEAEYKVLRKAMSKSGFSRTILDTQKIKFHLPNGEYGISSNLEPNRIMTIVKNAVEQTNKNFGILLSHTQNVTFYNLAQVKKGTESIQQN